MLPAEGVTGQEPFLSGTLLQKRAWLLLLYKMLRRARSTNDVSKVDKAIVAAKLPENSLRKPLVKFTDQDVQAGIVQARLETLLSVLRVFPMTCSPIGRQNRSPMADEAAVLIPLLDDVANCYTAIAQRKADAQIEEYFLVDRSSPKAEQVRTLFKQGAETVRNLQSVLNDEEDPPPRVILSASGELDMKGALALGSPLELILSPSYTSQTANPSRAMRVNTLLHECMHVVDQKIVDHFYYGELGFFGASFDQRINNADHFARVAIDYLNPNSSSGDQSTQDAIYAKIRNAEDKALIKGALGTAQGLVRTAWIYSLDAWNALKRLHEDPGYYDHLGWVRYRLIRILFGRCTDGPSLRRNASLISQISQATLHERAAAGDSRVPLVTAFDLAALEETIKDLHALLYRLRTIRSIQIVATYPNTPAPGVLYVRSDTLKTRDPDKLAESFIFYIFSRFNQTLTWLRPGNELITNIRSMVAEKNTFRQLPDKPADA